MQARVEVVGTDLVGVTNGRGQFAIAQVPTGLYDLEVKALGFRSLTYLGYEVTGVAGVVLELQLEPTRPMDAGAPLLGDKALDPGFGIGAGIAFDGLGGAGESAIQNAAAVEGFVTYGFGGGLLARAGARISRRRIQPADYPYGLLHVYVEPRFMLQSLSPRFAPFVAAQVGVAQEHVDHRAMGLSATGVSFGGGGGVIWRVATQVSAEFGGAVGSVRFGDYSFRGEKAWYNCLNTLEAGTSLPESVGQCSKLPGGPAVLCYAPFYPANDYRLSGDCSPPKIPYSGTGRASTWFRFWLAVHFSLKVVR